MATVVSSTCRLDGMSASRGNDISEMSESYYIVFDVPVNDPIDAITSSGYTIGQNHPNYSSFKLSGISCDPIKGNEWLFSLVWTDGATQSSSSATPAEFKALISYGSWSFQRVVEVDKQDNLTVIENSAGEKFDPPPLENITYPTISVTVRRNTPDIDFIEDVGSINLNAIDIVGVTIPAFCGMLADYRIEPVTDPQTGLVRYNNTFTFHLNFNKDQNDDTVTIGFKTQIANVGLNELKSGETIPQRILDLNQEPVNTPQFLKGGLLADKGEVSRDPNYLTYVINDVIDFTAFGLPTTYPSY